MAYERQTRSTGFRGRTGVITNSNKLAQKAQKADKDRVESVNQMIRQANSISGELNRISGIAAGNDEYKLQQLAKFSDTLNTALDTAAKKVYKPYQDAKREEGLVMGAKAAQGDPEAQAYMKLSDAQTKKIDDAVKKQFGAVIAETDKIEAQAYRATLQEKQRLLNIRKMGSNVAWGYRRGLLIEASRGWKGHLINQLTANPLGPDGKPLALETITTSTGKEVTVSQFWNYDPETQDEIIAHVQREYVKDNSYGFDQHIVNTYLTKTIVDATGKFQQEVLEENTREAGRESIQAIKSNFEVSIPNLFSNGEEGKKQFIKELKHSIQVLPSLAKQLSYGRELDGTVKETGNNLLLGMLKDIASEDDNIDNIAVLADILDTTKIYIKGLTPKGGQTLPELWKAFDTKKFVADSIKAHYKKVEEENRNVKTLVTDRGAEIFARWRTNDPENPLDTTGAHKLLDDLENEYKQFPEVISIVANFRKKINESKHIRDDTLATETGNNIVESQGGEITEAQMNRFSEDVKNKFREDGVVVDQLYLRTTEEKAVKETYSEQLLNKIKKRVYKVARVDENVAESQKIIDKSWAFITTEAKRLENEQGMSRIDALKQASQLHMQAFDWDNDGKRDTNHDLPIPNLYKYDTGTDRWVYDDFNLAPSTKVDKSVDLTKKNDKIFRKIALDAKNYEGDYYKDVSFGLKPESFKTKFGVDGTRLDPIWTTLAQKDPFKRPAQVLYNYQAELTEGVEPIKWPPEVQAEIDWFMDLTVPQREALSSGNMKAITRIMNEKGMIEPSALVAAMNPNFDNPLPEDILVSEAEYKTVLQEAGLKSDVSYQELIDNPELLYQATVAKATKMVKLANSKSDNREISLRMAVAAMKFGEENLENWSDPRLNDYTFAGMKSYITGNYDPELLTDEFSFIPVDDDEGAPEVEGGDILGEAIPNTIEGLTEYITQMETREVPIKRRKEDIRGFTREENIILQKQYNRLPFYAKPLWLANMELNAMMGMNKVSPENPLHKLYQTNLQIAKDKLFVLENIGNARESLKQPDLPNVVVPFVVSYTYADSGFSDFSHAAERLLGQERYYEILEEARSTEQWQTAHELIDQKDRQREKISVLSNILGQEPMFDGSFLDVPEEVLELTDADLVDVSHLANYVRGGELTDTKHDVQVHKDAAPDVEALFAAAKKDGHDFKLNSGYRNVAHQREEYLADHDPKFMAREKNNEKGYRSKKPGHSVHNLGKAIDIQYIDQDGLNWLYNNADKYNFYPFENRLDFKDGEKESWHWEWRPKTN